MLLTIGGSLISILIILSVVSWFSTKSIMVKELRQKSRIKVEIASRHINSWLRKRGQILQAVADREEIQWSSKDLKQEFFKVLMTRYKKDGISTIYMGMEDGDYATGTYRIPPPEYIAKKRPWYIAAKKKGSLVFTKPYIDWLTKRYVLTVAVPIYVNGKLMGVIAMDTFMDDIVTTVKELRIGKDSSAYVVNTSGVYMTHQDIRSVGRQDISKTSDFSHFEDFKRRPMGQLFSNTKVYEIEDYTILSPIAITGWTVIFHLPFSQVNSPLKRLAKILLGIITLAILFITLAIFLISYRITKPVLSLAEEAGNVAAGNYDVEMVVNTRDELGYVAHCFNDMTEGLRDREFIKSTFGRYVSKDVMQEILSGNIELGGEKMELAVLFSDIRGFTSISEDMDPMELVTILNGYFDQMDRAISKEGGSINKYMGDGILAIFGAPQPLENPSTSAVAAAMEKIENLKLFNKEKNLDLRIGIGVHTGEAVVGNIGSEARTEYTVIGDTVNLGARVESLTKLYGKEILITNSTRQKLDSQKYLCCLVDKVKVKGKNRAVTLYSPHKLTDLPADLQKEITQTNNLMERYFKGEFSQVKQDLLIKSNLDTHLKLILSRSEEYTKNPPPNWDGVSTMTKK
jgi:class 3 adenylate cyclase